MIRLGISETDVYEMNRWEQSIRYEALLRKEITGADADIGKTKEKADAEIANTDAEK